MDPELSKKLQIDPNQCSRSYFSILHHLYTGAGNCSFDLDLSSAMLNKKQVVLRPLQSVIWFGCVSLIAGPALYRPADSTGAVIKGVFWLRVCCVYSGFF